MPAYKITVTEQIPKTEEDKAKTKVITSATVMAASGVSALSKLVTLMGDDKED